MDPHERKRILGEWGPHKPNVREARDSKKLERDLSGSPVRGERIRFR